MNIENNKQKLSSYLRMAAQEKSTLGRADVESLLNRPTSKPFLKSTTFKISIMVTVAAIITSVFLFLNTGKEVQQQSKLETLQDVQTPMGNPIEEQELSLKADTPKVKAARVPVGDRKTVDSPNSVSEAKAGEKKEEANIGGPVQLKNVEMIRRMPGRTEYVLSNELEQAFQREEETKEKPKGSNTETGRKLINRDKITTVELNERALQKLNITVEQKVVVFRFKNIKMRFEKPLTDVEIDFNKSFVESVYALPDYLVPVFITDAIGNSDRFSNLPREEVRKIRDELRIDSATAFKDYESRKRIEREFMTRHINTLIPVLVESGRKYTLVDKAAKNWSPDVIFWFMPHDSLFSLLPQEVAGEIKNEVKEIRGTSANQASSCKYFEVCRSNSASVEEVKVYPNPTEGQFTLEIKASKQVRAQVGLYDLGGRAILNLDENKPLQEGITSSVYDISSVPAGIYLLIIQSGEGQFNYQRVVKR